MGTTPTGLTPTQRLIYGVIDKNLRGMDSHEIVRRLSAERSYSITEGALVNSLAKLVEKGLIAEENGTYALPDRLASVYDEKIAAAQEKLARETDRSKEFYPKMLAALEAIKPFIEAGEPIPDRAWTTWVYTSHQFTEGASYAESAQKQIEHYEAEKRRHA